MTDHEIAASIAKLIPEMSRDSIINNTEVIETMLKRAKEPVTPEPTFAYKMLPDFSGLWEKSRAAIEKIVTERNIAVENLTREQFVSAIMQAIKCGEFTRLVRQDGNAQQVVYIPYAREQELEAEIENRKDYQAVYENIVNSSRAIIEKHGLSKVPDAGSLKSDEAVSFDSIADAEITRLKAKHNAITAFIEKFLIPHRTQIERCWLDGFVECGAVTIDWTYPYGFVAARKL